MEAFQLPATFRIEDKEYTTLKNQHIAEIFEQLNFSNAIQPITKCGKGLTHHVDRQNEGRWLSIAWHYKTYGGIISVRRRRSEGKSSEGGAKNKFSNPWR
jgi:hypothetical protein